jgi:hypothetical protein
MDQPAEHIPPHSSRGGRRGYDSIRGGPQRNVTPNRDANAQQNRRGGKLQTQPNVARTPSQQQLPPHSSQSPSVQQAPTPPKPAESRIQNGPPTQPVAQELPPYDFNRTEVQSLLEQSTVDNIPTYKPKIGVESAKSGNPWAAKREFPTYGQMSLTASLTAQ